MEKNLAQLRSQLSFYNAMRLRVELPGGKITNVRECPEDVFASLISEAVKQSKDRETLEKELAQMAFGHSSDRWYCLNLLRRAGIVIGAAPPVES